MWYNKAICLGQDYKNGNCREIITLKVETFQEGKGTHEKKGRHEDKGLTGKLGQGETRTLREEPSLTKGGFVYIYVSL